MARAFHVNGESLVLVKGRSDSAIGSLSQLGLCSDSIRITLDFRHLDVPVDAYGQSTAETQFMGAEARIAMTLVHYDKAILNACLMESLAGAPTYGTIGRAGQLMGNGLALFAAGGVNGNHYISLNITSPVDGVPWQFYTSYLTAPPIEYPLGTERSLVFLNWRAIAYSTDPYNGGTGSYGVPLYSSTLAT